MIAIGYGTLAGVKSKQPGTLFDRFRNLGITHSGLASKNQADREWNPRRIHHAITAEPTVPLNESMSPGADLTLGRPPFPSLAFASLEAPIHRLMP